jgi:citrate synthase
VEHGITRIEPNKVAVRGYDIAELMGRVSFGAAVYLILTGELPSPAVARLMDAILVSSIDHGATPPSALRANRCVHRRDVKRIGRGRYHVDQSSSRRRD